MNEAALREVPRYALTEAAAMLHMSPATLRTWARGRSGQPSGSGGPAPLIHLPDPQVLELSFSNVIEALVLRALRTRYRLKMRGIRIAQDYVKQELGIDRIFLRKDLLATPGNMFLERYGKLINLNLAGQQAMANILRVHLERVGYNSEDDPARFYPLTRDDAEECPKVVVVDPRFSFGRAMTERRGIGASAIGCRFQAGESVAALAADHGLDPEDIEEAVRYEQAIAA